MAFYWMAQVGGRPHEKENKEVVNFVQCYILSSCFDDKTKTRNLKHVKRYNWVT